ncbi:autophagy-related protein 27 [Podospora didyma]|uniref:Autophagy-related protein 27 n=1 Tax=Podospora didyma TaxID=330526 RepID=A0AAE0U1E6_9PEZI|nr:autophagy-related protein 27 [Podospora didyma]
MTPPSTRRWRGLEPTSALLSLLLLTASNPLLADAKLLDCSKVVVNDHKYDFSKLGGPRSVVTTQYSPPSYYNTTYTLDLCAPLKRKGDVAKQDECPNGSRVCAIKHHWDSETSKSRTENVIPIAGNLADQGGGTLDWHAEHIPGKADSESEDERDGGLRLTLPGGIYQHRAQSAVIEFRCNRKFNGTEGEWESEDGYEPGEWDKEKATKRDDDKSDDKDKEKKPDNNEDVEGFPEKQRKKEGDVALIWESYKLAEDEKSNTLHLTWHTQFACISNVSDEPSPESSRWGLFTWLFIIVFLAVASYLIFGSWLNYNRYGARGWDLLPHGDAIRDIPWLLKDWTRRVLNTVQSSGSRGGYSAV